MNVFDTSAMLAILLAEDGQTRAIEKLSGAGASMINVAETAGKLVQAGGSAPDAMAAVRGLGLAWHGVSEAQVERVAALRAVKDLSLGDRFCIALAEARAEPLVTADRAWASLPIGVPVELIR